MKNIVKTLVLVAGMVMFYQCSNNKFTIAKGKVGPITAKTTVQDLEQVFKNDSIVKVLSEGAKGSNYFQEEDKYYIFEKGGKHLLTIIPKEQLDDSSTIRSVEIFDARYATNTGVTINSNFQEIHANSKIDKVETSFTSATLFLDALNATIAIDKEELGLKEFSTQKVSLEQIPDLAKVKSFTIWFN